MSWGQCRRGLRWNCWLQGEFADRSGKDGLIQGSAPRMGAVGLEPGDISQIESTGAPRPTTPDPTGKEGKEQSAIARTLHWEPAGWGRYRLRPGLGIPLAKPTLGAPRELALREREVMNLVSAWLLSRWATWQKLGTHPEGEPAGTGAEDPGSAAAGTEGKREQAGPGQLCSGCFLLGGVWGRGGAHTGRPRGPQHGHGREVRED